MKELYRSSDTALLGYYQSILEDAGIPYFVRNESTQQAVVGGLIAAILPLPDFWPALCVVNDEDYPEALRLLRAARNTPPCTEAEWKCPNCGEMVPGNFAACWNCDAGHP